MSTEPEALSVGGAADKLQSLMASDDATFDRQKADTQPDPQAAQQPTAADPAKPAADPQQAAQQPDEDAEIEYEGERYRLPAKLKDAFLRQQDYTKKTMDLAKQRKEIDELRTRNDPRVIEEMTGKLTKYEQLLGEQVLADSQKDWQKLLEEDPVEYLRQKELAEKRAAEWKDRQHKRTQEMEANHRQTLQQEGQQLLAKRPEWKDEAVFKADREKLVSFLQKEGYKDEEINSVTDHRILLVVDKARKYDELMASKQEAAKKIEKLPPKVERPGVPSGAEGQSNREAMSRLKKSGKVDDAADAISSLLR